MIDGKKISEFVYTKNTDKCIESILKMKIKDLECKHIMFAKDKLSKEVFTIGQNSNYKNMILGSQRTCSVKEETKIILDMCESSFFRPVRIVITENKVWADNTHTTLAYYLRYGEYTLVEQIPFYLIDLRKTVPKVIDLNEFLDSDINNIKSAIACSLRIKQRIVKGYRPSDTTWSIYNLCENMGLENK